MGQLHTHQIHVQTDDDLVTVQIGGEGAVPGGFAKLFNRVVDSEAWARLSDAGRAAYIPLVRFADQRNQFRIQIGQASLMKYAGLSRSSIKRAIKDLLASRLIVLVEQGGVTPDGRNESNLYQLMVPTDPKPRLIGGRTEPVAAPSPAPEPPPAIDLNPPGVRQRTPSRFAFEPPAGPSPDRPEGRERTVAPSRWTHGGGVARGPQLRSITDPEDSSTGAPAPQPVVARPSAGHTDAAALLEEHGVEPTVARQLATAFPIERVVDVIDTMKFRRSRGKCENPGGFIRDALVKRWQTPQSVIDARAKAQAQTQARARAEAETRSVRQSQTTQSAGVDAEQARIDAVLAALDDDELEMLAVEVLKKYDGNTAVLSVLTRKPPRACRLMKMEVAALLGRR